MARANNGEGRDRGCKMETREMRTRRGGWLCSVALGQVGVTIFIYIFTHRIHIHIHTSRLERGVLEEDNNSDRTPPITVSVLYLYLYFAGVYDISPSCS